MPQCQKIERTIADPQFASFSVYFVRVILTGCTAKSSTPFAKASGATLRMIFPDPLQSAWMYRPFDARYNPRFTRFPLNVYVVSSSFFRIGNGSRSRKLALLV